MNHAPIRTGVAPGCAPGGGRHASHGSSTARTATRAATRAATSVARTAAAAWLLAATATAQAQPAPSASAADWPQKGRPVRVVLPFPAGAGSDASLRVILQRLAEQTGGSFIVDNKPGAGTLIGAQDVARAAPDGYTLLYTIVVTHTQNPHLYRKLPYDPFKDFTPIVQAVRSATILVTQPNAPYNNVRELVAYARQHPGELNYASYSIGSTSQLNAEILKRNAGLDIVHVPYKGVTDATRAVMAGDAQLYFDGTASAIESAKGGKFKLLGVAADKRLAVLPDLPTIAEQGVPGIDIVGWQGFFGPGGMPRPLAEKIARSLDKVLRSPEIAELVRTQGNEVSGAGPDAFARIVRQDYERWGEVIRRAGIRLD